MKQAKKNQRFECCFGGTEKFREQTIASYVPKGKDEYGRKLRVC